MASKFLKTGIIALFLVFSAAIADEVELNPNHPNSYIVKKGDTLWDISGMFLKEPWRWPDIWDVNPQIENPHLIYPGDVLSLTYDANGRPRLGVKRGPKVVKLSPHARASKLERAIPTIPISKIYPYLTRHRIVTKEEIDSAAYIVAPPNEHVLAVQDQKIYARRIPDNETKAYDIVHVGKTYINPVKKDKNAEDEILGYETIHVGEAEKRRSGDPATLHVTDTVREARVADLLFPSTDAYQDTHFLPRKPDKKVDGVILSVHDGVDQIGQFSVITINLGKQDGMEPGHVLKVYQAGQTIRDLVTEDSFDEVTLPDEPAGIIMVFRTFERVSYALVMKAHTNMHTLDRVSTPK
jgi:hypothetical protein